MTYHLNIVWIRVSFFDRGMKSTCAKYIQDWNWFPTTYIRLHKEFHPLFLLILLYSCNLNARHKKDRRNSPPHFFLCLVYSGIKVKYLLIGKSRQECSIQINFSICTRLDSLDFISLGNNHKDHSESVALKFWLYFILPRFSVCWKISILASCNHDETWHLRKYHLLPKAL